MSTAVPSPARHRTTFLTLPRELRQQILIESLSRDLPKLSFFAEFCNLRDSRTGGRIMGWRFKIVRQEMEAKSLQEKRRIQQWSKDLINTHHELRHDAEYTSDKCLVQVQAWETKSLDELISWRLKLGKPVGQQQASMLAIFITTLYLQIHVIALNFVPGPTRYFLRPIWLSIRSKEAAALFHEIRLTAFLTHLFSEPSSPLALLHVGIVFLLVIKLAMMRLDHMFVVSVPEGVWMVVFSSAIVVMMVTDDHSSLYHQVLHPWWP